MAASIDFIDLLLLVLSIVLIIIGIIGCVLPVLPGPPLSYLALITIHFSDYAEIKTSALIIFGLIAATVQVLDYIVPAWGTKKFGGTKYGSWGSIIGLIIGVFFLPLGPFGILSIITFPFLGALIGEKINGQDSKKATKAAFGSFIGFLTGTFLKIVTSIVITVFFVIYIIKT